jgi:uncharacterized membrane protein
MTTAAIRFYDVVLFLHVTAIVVGLGPTFAYAFFQAFAERNNPRSIPNVMRTFHAVDRFLVVPGLIVVLAAGLYLVLDGPWDWGDTFVGVGLAIVLVLLILSFTFFPSIERKLAALAERDIAAGGGDVELSDEYWAASKRSAQIGSLAGVLVLVALFFMVVKP